MYETEHEFKGDLIFSSILIGIAVVSVIIFFVCV